MIPNYNTEDTRWKDAYMCLKNAGFTVYSAGQKVGDCTSAYVVIRFAGRYKKVGFSTNDVTYELMCYVPLNAYSSLDTYCQEVKIAMAELYPMFRDLHSELPDFVDEDVKGHMRTLQYGTYEQILR